VTTLILLIWNFAAVFHKIEDSSSRKNFENDKD
jgi:hypothetical protein